MPKSREWRPSRKAVEVAVKTFKEHEYPYFNKAEFERGVRTMRQAILAAYRTDHKPERGRG